MPRSRSTAWYTEKSGRAFWCCSASRMAIPRTTRSIWPTKTVKMRVFTDENDKMNRSLADVGGGLLIVSQFTLYGDAARATAELYGRGASETAIPLYEAFIARCRESGLPVETRRVRRGHEGRAAQRRPGHALDGHEGHEKIRKETHHYESNAAHCRRCRHELLYRI